MTIRIVPYRPDDYSLSKVLGEVDGKITGDTDFISSALSLLFQWPEYSSAKVALEPDFKASNDCRLEHDEDEINPSELYLRTDDDAAIGLNAKLWVRFEIFNNCYQFKTDAIDSFSDEGGRTIIVDPPSELVVFNARLLPRVKVERECFVEMMEENKTTKWRVHEVGMRGILISGDHSFSEQVRLKFENGSLVDAELVSGQGYFKSYRFIFNTGIEVGHFFDFYREFRYPGLRLRKEVDYERIIECYKESGYMGKYEEEGKTDPRDLLETWPLLENATHESVADYVISHDGERVTGASSLALAFLEEDTPIWAFHQLCSLKDPSLLQESGSLYKWRAEYLAARPENLKVCVWFDGRSRWLERIYVKFKNESKDDVDLYATNAFEVSFNGTDNHHDVVSTKYGNSNRFFLAKSKLLAAAGPNFLNASGHLNCICDLEDKFSEQDILSVGNSLASFVKTDNLRFRVSLGNRAEIKAYPYQKQVSNRACFFSKSSLNSFLNSIDHSIAVTIRKKEGSN